MQRIGWWSAAALSATVVMASCGGVSPEDGGSPALSREQEQHQGAFTRLLPDYKIFPAETGAEIDWVPLNNAANAQHYVWLPAAQSQKGKLFVFMAGTGNKPADYQYFSGEAARAGYHVIGLMYRNDKAIESVCPADATLNPPRPTSPDPDCSGKMRLETLTGVEPPADISNDVSVNVANGIDYRLTKLLVYLDGRSPRDGWSRFLKDGKPDWSRIAVGGQSQGAGQAALIAQLRHVLRVVMLSGPPDSQFPNHVPLLVDSWVHIGKTPASKHFALYHHRDRFVRGPANGGTTGTTTNLSALDLDRFGPAMAVGAEGPYCTTDDLGTPSDSSFGQTRLLVTDLVPRGDGACAGAGPGNPHRSTARDDFTPLAADGVTPRLLGAWRYLLGASEEDGQDEEGQDS